MSDLLLGFGSDKGKSHFMLLQIICQILHLSLLFLSKEYSWNQSVFLHFGWPNLLIAVVYMIVIPHFLDGIKHCAAVVLNILTTHTLSLYFHLF